MNSIEKINALIAQFESVKREGCFYAYNDLELTVQDLRDLLEAIEIAFTHGQENICDTVLHNRHLSNK